VVAPTPPPAAAPPPVAAPPSPSTGRATPAPEPAKKGPNKALIAGIAAGTTCLIGSPCIFCCAGGLLCAWIPCVVAPVAAAGGAAIGAAIDSQPIEPVPLAAAAGAAFLGAAASAIITVGINVALNGTAAVVGGTNPNQAPAAQTGALLLSTLFITGIAGVAAIATGGLVFGAVYFLWPDPPPGAATAARAEPQRERQPGDRAPAPDRRVAMAY
jgi:hypothetical protein